MSEYMEKHNVSRLIGALRRAMSVSKRVASSPRKSAAGVCGRACWMKSKGPSDVFNHALASDGGKAG